MTTKPKIAFIGLGVMGAPMAAHLGRAGYHVTGYNRTQARAQNWLDRFAHEDLPLATAPTPALATQGADIVITCVGNDDDLAEVTTGPDGAFSSMKAGTLFIDHTTVSANKARELDRIARQSGFDALDAPISGGQAGAENGKLAIMCGGSEAAFARALPVFQAYGARMVHVGPAGAGQTTKMANQICIAGILGGLSEAIRLANAAGLDSDRVLEAISGGAAQSWQMENRWTTMARDEFDFGFAVDWMRKDLGYALEEVRRLGLGAPVTALIDQFYADIQAMGGGRQDTSSLIRRLPEGDIAEGTGQ
ncbi:MAG: NAD(P)-dependent oxidoreductase [Sphingomonadaceae bacterium]